MFAQGAEPGPPRSRDERAAARAAGTQKRLVQTRPGAGGLASHGWARTFLWTRSRHCAQHGTRGSGIHRPQGPGLVLNRLTPVPRTGRSPGALSGSMLWLTLGGEPWKNRHFLPAAPGPEQKGVQKAWPLHLQHRGQCKWCISQGRKADAGVTKRQGTSQHQSGTMRWGCGGRHVRVS